MFIIECSQCHHEIIQMTGGAKAMFGAGTSVACVTCGNIYLFTKENIEKNKELVYNKVEAVV